MIILRCPRPLTWSFIKLLMLSVIMLTKSCTWVPLNIEILLEGVLLLDREGFLFEIVAANVTTAVDSLFVVDDFWLLGSLSSISCEVGAEELKNLGVHLVVLLLLRVLLLLLVLYSPRVHAWMGRIYLLVVFPV